ncbi:YceI family protein [Sulfuritalea sp.]|uniref:YceI family protein n=1 Tax=Sulfuritalea sp. TaxID=2480090 RepID=UPI00286E0A12|nr:YceI family protein [Sulfuritalea sp.]
MKFWPHRLVLCCAFATLAPAAHAIEFNQLQLNKSSLSFVSKQMNVPVEGQFKSFRSKLAYDPAKPAAAKAELEIDMASIDAGSKDANDEVAGKAWFNTKAFPVAKFVATSVKPLGGNRLEVAGKMSIKGKTLDLTTPVTVTQQGNAATFDGSLVLKRADYGIGDGIWADFGTVANEVQIKFRLVATAAAAK